MSAFLELIIEVVFRSVVAQPVIFAMWLISGRKKSYKQFWNEADIEGVSGMGMILLALGLLCFYVGIAACSEKEPDNTRASIDTISHLEETVVKRDDSFSVGSLVFLERPLDTSVRVVTSCPKGYQTFEDNDFLGQIVRVYEIQQNVDDYSFDSAFFAQFMVDEPTTNIELMDTSFGLGSPVIKEVEIGNYGKCIIGSFQLDWATSATQEFPTVVINRSKREASLWFFNGFQVRNGIIEVDLKVRNYKHSFILAKYDPVSKSFVATCSKGVVDEDY